MCNLKLFLDYKYILKFIKNGTNTRASCYNATIRWRPIVNMPIVNCGCNVAHEKEKIILGEGTNQNAAAGVETDIIYQCTDIFKATVENSSTN